jgi:hypothetical protein
MFVRKAGAYPIVAHKRSSDFKVGSFSLPTNISLGWKSSSGTETLADYEHSSITDVKSFITLGPGCHPERKNF